MAHVILLNTAPGRKYVQVSINLEKGEFETTDNFYEAEKCVPFGFPGNIAGDALAYTHPDNKGKTIDEVRIKAFNVLAQKIDKIAGDYNVAFVPVEVIENRDWGASWRLIVNYQLILH